MQYSVENVSGMLIRSRLFSPEEVKAIYDRWLKEGKDKASSSLHFLKWLVAKLYLTEYQASLISRGQADDFFLDQYKIIDRLGKGRMAGVYKAKHPSGQVVAIKVLPPSRAKDPHMLARFQREARLSMRLKHPNVVRSFQVGETKSLHYLVMEYLEGETLEEVLKRRKQLPPQEAARLVNQGLHGLQHIHDSGMIHRDLKPANLMLVPIPGSQTQPGNTLQYSVKILDIGLGRELFDENARSTPEDLELTSEGMILGTPDYLAPEQARDARIIDIRADIYSFGCVLYHCLTGQPPFPDKSVINQMIRHATETPRPVKELAAEVPEGLQQILNWMLAKNPEDRYQTPLRAAQALQLYMVAGAEVRPIEDSPQMQKYLTWLETEKKGSNGQAETEIENIPQVQATKPDTPPKEIKKGSSAKKKPPAKAEPKKADSEKSKVNRPRPAISKGEKSGKKQKSQSQVAEELDVELVPMPMIPLQPNTRTPISLQTLTRRDWFMLAIGAGAVLVSALFGWVLSKIF